jgi:hypothetical protein
MEGYTPILLLTHWYDGFTQSHYMSTCYANWMHPVFTEFNLN